VVLQAIVSSASQADQHGVFRDKLSVDRLKVGCVDFCGNFPVDHITLTLCEVPHEASLYSFEYGVGAHAMMSGKS